MHSLISSIFVGTRGYCACLYFFFSVFCFLFLDWSLFGESLVIFFPIGTRDWRVCPSSTLQVWWSVPLFYCTNQLLLYYQHNKSQVMKYLSHLYVKLLPCYFPVELCSCLYWCSFWTMVLIKLVNIDVVSPYWEELEISRSLSKINDVVRSCC